MGARHGDDALEQGLIEPTSSPPAARCGRQARARDDEGRCRQRVHARLVHSPDPHHARFKPGDRVRTRNINPPTHTRLPRYARGRVGAVEAVRGCHVFPDSVATGAGEDPQWLYTVVFDARELWGDADPTLTVSIDAFEPYLEQA